MNLPQPKHPFAQSLLVGVTGMQFRLKFLIVAYAPHIYCRGKIKQKARKHSPIDPTSDTEALYGRRLRAPVEYCNYVAHHVLWFASSLFCGWYNVYFQYSCILLHIYVRTPILYPFYCNKSSRLSYLSSPATLGIICLSLVCAP